MLGERPNKKNIESLNLTRKVKLWCGKYLFFALILLTCQQIDNLFMSMTWKCCYYFVWDKE